MRHKRYLNIFLIFLLSFVCFSTVTAKSAQSIKKEKSSQATLYRSPIGKWITPDNRTKKPRAIVKIYKAKNHLFGKILKVFPKPGDTGRCRNCPGIYHNKSIKGLTFLWNLQKKSAQKWSDGRIMDPKSGKVYRCKVTLIDGGKKLKVRGYIGFSLLGRTQIWKRKITR